MNDNDKVILITGAASGIGLAATNYLIKRGHYVIATDKNTKSLEYLKEDNRVFIVEMDITSDKSVSNALEIIENKFSAIDGIVNSAGIFTGGPLVEISLKEIEKIVQTNLIGLVRVNKFFFPLLYKRKGRIVLISSEAGRLTHPFSGPYSLTKHAIESYGDALRRELMFLGMKVIIIQPGAMNTHLLSGITNFYEKYLTTSLFKQQIKKIYSMSEKEIHKGADPLTVAKIIYKSLFNKNPKIRYKVKNNRERMILEFLPPRVVDWLIKLIL